VLNAEYKSLETGVNWLQQLQKLGNDVEAQKQTVIEVNQDLQHFEKKEKTLINAEKAARLTPLFESKQQSIQQHERVKQQLLDIEQKRNSNKTLMQKAQQDKDLKSTQLQAQQQTTDNILDDINRTLVPLELAISDKQSQLEQLKQEQQQKSHILERQSQKVTEQKTQINDFQTQIQGIQSTLTLRAYIPQISEKLSTISFQLNQLSEMQQKQLTLSQTLTLAEKKKSEAIQSSHKAEQAINVLMVQVEPLTLALQKTQSDIEHALALLPESSLATANTQLMNIQNELDDCQTALPLVVKLDRIEADLVKITDNKTNLVAALQVENEQLIAWKTQGKQLADEVKNTEKLLEQDQIIQSLSTLQMKVKENEPCPLCGSLVHPALVNYQKIDTSHYQSRLKEQQQQLLEARNRYSELNGQLKTKQQQLQQIQSSLDGVLMEREEQLQQWSNNAYLVTLEYHAQSHVLLLKQKQALTLQAQQLSQKMEAVRSLEKRQTEQSNQLQAFSTEKHHLLLTQQQSLHTQTSLTEQLEQCTAESAQMTSKIADIKQAIIDSLPEQSQLSGSNELTFIQPTAIFEQPAQWLAEVEKQVIDYQQQLVEEQQLQQKLLEVLQQHSLAEQIAQQQLELSQQLLTQISKLTAQLTELQQQRKVQFGDLSQQHLREQAQQQLKK
jgi:exonuclease SbcC